jgi:hypothetical protein
METLTYKDDIITHPSFHDDLRNLKNVNCNTGL